MRWDRVSNSSGVAHVVCFLQNFLLVSRLLMSKSAEKEVLPPSIIKNILYFIFYLINISTKFDK